MAENGGEMTILIGLIKQVQQDMASGFDKLDGKYETVNRRFEDYALREDLKNSNETILNSFSQLTAKMEEVLVTNATSAQKFVDFERRIIALEAGNSKKSDSRTILWNTLIAGSIASIISAIVGYLIKH